MKRFEDWKALIRAKFGVGHKAYDLVRNERRFYLEFIDANPRAWKRFEFKPAPLSGLRRCQVCGRIGHDAVWEHGHPVCGLLRTLEQYDRRCQMKRATRHRRLQRREEAVLKRMEHWDQIREMNAMRSAEWADEKVDIRDEMIANGMYTEKPADETADWEDDGDTEPIESESDQDAD